MSVLATFSVLTFAGPRAPFGVSEGVTQPPLAGVEVSLRLAVPCWTLFSAFVSPVLSLDDQLRGPEASAPAMDSLLTFADPPAPFGVPEGVTQPPVVEVEVSPRLVVPLGDPGAPRVSEGVTQAPLVEVEVPLRLVVTAVSEDVPQLPLAEEEASLRRAAT